MLVLLVWRRRKLYPPYLAPSGHAGSPRWHLRIRRGIVNCVRSASYKQCMILDQTRDEVKSGTRADSLEAVRDGAYVGHPCGVMDRL